MKIESIKRDVDDVWTGAYHSFIKQMKKFRGHNEKQACYYAWGMNNYG